MDFTAVLLVSYSRFDREVDHGLVEHVGRLEIEVDALKPLRWA